MYNISIQLKGAFDLEDIGTQLISSVMHHVVGEDDIENGIY
jgi:hypothetical protein